MQRFRGGLVFKAHGLLYHSTLGLRVINKKKVYFIFGPRDTGADATMGADDKKRKGDKMEGKGGNASDSYSGLDVRHWCILSKP